MFRGIVFGDFGGIDEGVWVQLWSGAIGAIPAALLAAWVAVSVLKRSNRHQQELVERQLAVQRKEAQQARRRSVLADLQAAASGFRAASEASPEALEAQRLLFETHAYRWELEGRVPGNDLEVLKWANVMWNPCFSKSRVKSAPAEMRKDWDAFLDDVETAFKVACLGLGFATDDERPVALGIMAKQRGEFVARWEALLESLEFEVSRDPEAGASS